MYKLITLLLCLGLCSVAGAQIDPTQQINWTLGPIPQMQPAFINGVPQVASWSGSDACAKLHNAMLYALSNGLPLVDATGLNGIQPCASNPFLHLNDLNNTAVKLTIKFGATHFQTTVPWVIINSGIQLQGLGAYSTQVQYTGPSCVGTPATCSVLTLNGGDGPNNALGASGLTGIGISGIWFYGAVDATTHVSNAYDGLHLIFVNRSRFESVYAWGVTHCGISTNGAVTDTFINPRVSVADAFIFGIQLSGFYPSGGLCFGGLAGAIGGNEDTTSGTIMDAGIEGIQGVGIHLTSADQMTFIGGTSESNTGGGILIDSSASGVNAGTSNKFNMVLTMDLEGNGPDFTGDDIQDNGQLNTYLNILAASPCSSPCTGTVNLVGGGSNYFLNGFPKSGAVGAGLSGNSPVGFASGTAIGGAATLPSNPDGFIVQQLNGANVKIPYYH